MTQEEFEDLEIGEVIIGQMTGDEYKVIEKKGKVFTFMINDSYKKVISCRNVHEYITLSLFEKTKSSGRFF